MNTYWVPGARKIKWQRPTLRDLWRMRKRRREREKELIWY